MTEAALHGTGAAPSPWVVRWAARVTAGGTVLDVACGAGRHARWLAARGHPVLAVDRAPDIVDALAGVPGVETMVADLEAGDWPLAGRRFAGVVVTNYLHRPLLPLLIDALAPDGVLIYETFSAGNEAYGRPANPAFLLQPGELLEAVHGRLDVLAYEDGRVATPKPAMIQRICAIPGSRRALQFDLS